MTSQEALIHQYALRRLAEVFHVSVESLLLDMKFGKELKARPVSCFTENEFDVIDNDIRDVADKAVLKEMAHGLLEIRTVEDYCKHMLRCNAVKPVDVARLLQLPKNE
ncbi:hypothetical protein [Rugamonas sp. DEMB1]|uniref:hypothetical protein n=1 Tax=Rugamonas sp. DEMB1 TaxID=3039386 RepID=UPI00244A50A8|nr:hypothetical protein [Rugamonas sp. DEMB1]WGG52877.1 hypothetical protein QC826_12470 [Rugamonas sp. DEMB1]